jgi:predicted peptidase
MRLLLAGMLLAQVGAGAPARIQNLTLPFAEAGGTITYGIAVPAGYNSREPRPLVLALHPGGEMVAYKGSAFMRQIVLPALGDLRAIVVAPDSPVRSWTEPVADRAVMALLEKVLGEYAIDKRRILVTGFSMGGRGTWFMASHHADLFTGAIPIAASVTGEPIEGLGTMPTYIIHSRNDQVVPFEPAARNARELERLGRAVRFEELSGVGHYEMGGYVDALRRAVRWIADRWEK